MSAGNSDGKSGKAPLKPLSRQEVTAIGKAVHLGEFAVTVGSATPDITTQLEDGSIGYLTIVAIHDTRSGKVLVWRMGVDGELLARQTWGELIRQHGIPAKVTMDDHLAEALAESCVDFQRFVREEKLDVPR